MNPSKISLPICCDPQAFHSLYRLVRQSPQLDTSDAFIGALVAIAMHGMDRVSLRLVDEELQGYADAIRKRSSGRHVQAIIAHMHDVLFDEAKFTGNSENYDDPRNSFLPAVLASKKGSPSMLCAIYKIIGERLGLRVSGIPMPGHFLVGVEEAPDHMLIIDPFYKGTTLTPEEACARMRSILGEETDWLDSHLDPTTYKSWVTRIVQHALNSYTKAEQWNNVGGMLEIDILLWPDKGELYRDLGLVLARAKHPQQASECLRAYLLANPEDPEAKTIRDLLSGMSRQK